MARAINRRYLKEISVMEMGILGPAFPWDEEHLEAFRAATGDDREWLSEHEAWRAAGEPPLEEWQERKMAKGIDPCCWPESLWDTSERKS